jgi:hypothetical protein
MRIFVEFDLTNRVHQEIYNYVRARMQAEVCDVKVDLQAPTVEVEKPSTLLGSGSEEKVDVGPDEVRELIAALDELDGEMCMKLCLEAFSDFGANSVSELNGNQLWTLRQILRKEINAREGRF